MRRLLLLAVLPLLLVLPWTAHADEVRAPLPIALEDIELLPVHEVEWAQLLHEHRDVVTRLMFLGERIKKVYGHLQAREDKQDGGSLKLIEQIQRIREDLRPHLTRLLELIRPFGIDEHVLQVLADAPRGERRIERQAMRVVLQVPRLTSRQRELLAPLAGRVEGALLALEHLRGRDGVDESVLDVEQLALQKRYWRVVDATLDRDQRVALRRRLPKDMAKYADLFAVLYTLPGLTAPQGTRLKALLVELEQAAAPDQAVVARVQARLAEGVEGAERARLEREKQAAEGRNVALYVRVWAEGLAVLTPDQRAELAAVPPLLTVQERPGDLEVWLQAFELTPAQQTQMHDLFVRYGPVKGRMLQRLARAALMADGFGPDAPQQEMAETMKAQAYAEALAEARKAAHEIVRDVLTTEQIQGWVLGGE